MLYELIVRQAYFGRSPLNVFHFNMTGTPATVTGSFALAKALGFIPNGLGEFPPGSLFDQWRNSVTNDLQFLEVEAKALYDVEDFYLAPFAGTVQGALTGESNSPVIAVGLRSSRVRTDIRGGHKRFAGVPESYVDEGGVLNAGAVTNWQYFADVLSDAITYDDEGNTLTFTSAVLALEMHPATEDRGVVYTQYPTLAEQLDHAALGVDWSVMAHVRTQVSRQYKTG